MFSGSNLLLFDVSGTLLLLNCCKICISTHFQSFIEPIEDRQFKCFFFFCFFFETPTFFCNEIQRFKCTTKESKFIESKQTEQQSKRKSLERGGTGLFVFFTYLPKKKTFRLRRTDEGFSGVQPAHSRGFLTHHPCR